MLEWKEWLAAEGLGEYDSELSGWRMEALRHMMATDF